MPAEFTNIEQTIENEIVASMSRYSADVVKRGAIDIAFDNARANHAEDPRFCVISNHGGYAKLDKAAFAKPAFWNHHIYIDFYVPVNSSSDFQQVEDDVRQDYDEFLSTVGRMHRHFTSVHKQFAPIRAFPPMVVSLGNQPYVRLRFLCFVTENLG